ncbi:DNA-binding protein [Stenotrophomonas bentonitica]
MSRGITELDVHQAADSLVIAGERPTVERVRAVLGTGSPNTVIRHLDAWWAALGARLVTQTAISALPDMPEAVAVLAQRLWREALDAAAGHAAEQVALERQALQDDRVTLSTERAALESRMAQLQQAAAEAGHDLQVSAATQRDLRDQLDRADHLVSDLQLQRDGAAGRADRLEAHLAELQHLLSANRNAHERERAELTEYIRSVENRGHQEVDRLRQHLAATARERDVATTRAADAARTQEEALRVSRQDVATAREDARLHKAVAEASMQQLAALQALPNELAELRKLIDAQPPRGARRRITPIGHKGGTAKQKLKAARATRAK